jgi:hypothetical protein
MAEQAYVTEVAVQYRQRWADGFGARGWKLAEAMEEDEVIAVTAYAGERVPTSVLVHDILDHWLPGWPLSGHRAEARALIQLAARTGADPQPDLAQMVDEDLLRGHCHGEPLETFLPPLLATRLPEAGSDRERMAALCADLGPGLVRAMLVARFVELGWEGMAEARAAWWRQGLDYERRDVLGRALQGALEWADTRVDELGCEAASGRFRLGNEAVSFVFDEPADGGEQRVAFGA